MGWLSHCGRSPADPRFLQTTTAQRAVRGVVKTQLWSANSEDTSVRPVLQSFRSGNTHTLNLNFPTGRAGGRALRECRWPDPSGGGRRRLSPARPMPGPRGQCSQAHRAASAPGLRPGGQGESHSCAGSRAHWLCSGTEDRATPRGTSQEGEQPRRFTGTLSSHCLPLPGVGRRSTPRQFQRVSGTRAPGHR